MFTDYENKAMTRYEKKKLKLNAPLRGNPKGTVVRIEVDKDGVPVDQYWRNRVKDAAIDGCVEFVKPTKKGK